MARLAVTEHAQGRGIGRALLQFAWTLARRMAEEIGCVSVVVDAKPQARAYSLRYGFESVSVIEVTLSDRPEPIPMCLPLSSIPSRDNA